jgi:hypothetical protein
MRPEISELVALGRFPEDVTSIEAVIERQDVLLKQIEPPVTDEEARALTQILGPDDYFGLAFAVRGFIETAPGWPLWDVLSEPSDWIDDLRARAIRGGFRPPET